MVRTLMNTYPSRTEHHHDSAATTVNCLKPWDWRCTIAPLMCVACALVMFPWSQAIFHFAHKFLRALPLSSFFDTVVELTAWPVIAVILLAVYRLDKSQRRFAVYLLCALLATALANGSIKQIAGRSRPDWSVSMSPKKKTKLIQYNTLRHDYQVPVTKTDHWFGLTLHRPFFMDRYASFPSGHAAAAFAMAAFLTTLYPQMRRVWLTAALGCALARVFGQRHYLEDIMVGGAIGWLIAHWTFTWEWPQPVQTAFVQIWNKSEAAT